MTTSFISEMARRLQGQGPSLALPLTWIEQTACGIEPDHRPNGAAGKSAASSRSGFHFEQHS